MGVENMSLAIAAQVVEMRKCAYKYTGRHKMRLIFDT